MLSCFLSFALASIPGHSAVTYDFYLHGVRKGFARTEVEGNAMYIDSESGFAESSRLQLRLDGSRPLDAIFEAKSAGRVIYAIDGAPAAESKPIGHAALYSPVQPALLPFLLAAYDLKKGGFQALPATDLYKGTPRLANAELYRTTVRRIGGHDQVLREWRLETPPTTEAIVWTDDQSQPLHWWIPAQNFEVVRRGYDELRPSAKFAGKVSPSRFATKVEKDVWVPMRDGIRLQADVYRPDAEGKYPVILQRTCYDRSEFGSADGEFYSQRGFVYVTQHVRGRGGSEGSFEPEQHEDLDGYDTVAWCGTQPWSNGRVGMIGASYNGFCDWMAAKTRPIWLKTMISVVPMPGSPYGAPWDGGAFYIGDMLGWFGLLRDKAKVQPFAVDMTAALNTLPLSKADNVLFGHDVKQYDDMLRATRLDSDVRKTSYRGDLSKVNLPVLYFDGWLDPVAVGTRMNYLDMTGHGAKNQKLIWGPWNHFTNRQSRDGLIDYTPEGYVDMQTISLRWFDRWLKGSQNGVDTEPSVDEYMLGENRWYHSDTWPPRNMRPRRWYLQTDRSLAVKRPAISKPSGYVYDPAKYIYSQSFYGSYFFLRAYDASELCKHEGQLLFDSKPLSGPLRLNGPIKGRLFASSSAVDTDWAMSLLDVSPSGAAVPLQTGFVRARFRKSFSKPELLKPGEIYGYDLDLWQTGITIPAGHRLRVVVCSTLYPDMDRNLNAGDPPADAVRIVVAHQKIYHDPLHLSYIELPVVQDKGPR